MQWSSSTLAITLGTHFIGMEPLEAAVAACCPLAFSGASGVLFLRAVTAVVAAHCGIIDDNRWPRDEAEDIFRNVNDEAIFDFVIVGAGTAGSIVASRLSNHFPTSSVLLVEAGDDPGIDSEIPALLFLNQNTNIDWNYKTKPDGRSCLGFNNNSCIWSKGRAMGGSSSINAMLYIRGHPNNYDEWMNIGNEGWSYKHLETYFQRVEDTLELSKCEHDANPWYGVIREAWKELDFNYVNSSNEAQIGTRITKLLTRNGKRLNSAKIYLRERENLHVIKNVTVQKIIIDPKTNIANGIEVRQPNGRVTSIKIKNEVILSAGSIATPQILTLSGIGPKGILQNNDLKCLVDLPVGKNLQDHVLLPIFLKTNLHTNLSIKEIVSFLMQYMLTKTGPFSNIGITDFMGFINTDDTLEYPNVQFHHTYFTQNDTFMLKPYLKGVGYREDIINDISQLNEESDLLGIYPTLLHPKSRGEIVLAEKDPKFKPIIKPNYFDKKEDLETLIHAITFIKKLTETNSFKALGIEVAKLNLPDCIKFSVDIDYWECYIRNMATTIYHPVGTVKMAPKHKGGVVNKELLVYGLKNVRVIDASVMPTITSGNIMAPTMMIAEKAADIIIEKYTSFKDEL